MKSDRSYYDVIISGFGGQGVLVIGNLLAYASMKEGKHVTYLPVYGVEMRGGTANCTVVISSHEIGSPVVGRPRGAIVMNLPSLIKYEPLIFPKGLLMINTSLIDKDRFREALSTMSHIFRAGICVSELVAIASAGEKLGSVVIPSGKIGLATVCSVIINGVSVAGPGAGGCGWRSILEPGSTRCGPTMPSQQRPSSSEQPALTV